MARKASGLSRSWIAPHMWKRRSSPPSPIGGFHARIRCAACFRRPSRRSVAAGGGRAHGRPGTAGQLFADGDRDRRSPRTGGRQARCLATQPLATRRVRIGRDRGPGRPGADQQPRGRRRRAGRNRHHRRPHAVGAPGGQRSGYGPCAGAGRRLGDLAGCPARRLEAAQARPVGRRHRKPARFRVRRSLPASSRRLAARSGRRRAG